MFATNAQEKVGWAPGRIPAARFRRATRMLGNPEVYKLKWKTMTLADLQTNYLSKFADVVGARKLDATLIKITDVHFSGTCNNQSKEQNLVKYEYDTVTSTWKGDPEVRDSYAYVFAPTTGNLSYPQSRYVKDNSNTNKVLIGTSEYARYALYYVPAAKYVGSITGILGYYADNGPKLQKNGIDATVWSITPCSMDEILPEAQQHSDPAQRWVPKEWKKGVAQPEE